MDTNKLLSLASRGLLSAIFVSGGVNKAKNWKQTSQYMASKNMPMIPLFLAGATTVELAAGLSVLLGRKHRLGAAALAAYLVPVSVVFHDFWKHDDPMQRQMELINFLKNLAIIGGLLHVATRERESPGALTDVTMRPETIGYIEIEEERAA